MIEVIGWLTVTVLSICIGTACALMLL